jgi:signal transduction histidine kinase
MKPVGQKAELLDQQIASLGVVEGRFLWYTRPGALIVFEYPLASGNSVPPPVHISSFQANDKVVDASATNSLSFDQNNCTIKYDGLSYKDERAVRYQYRLLGAANDWTPPTTQRTITFATLKPGAYTFEVLAMNADGIRSTAPAALSFTIVPPYWQRWWFFLLSAVAASAVLWIMYRYRINRVLEMERMRMRIAGDLHDDVGTNLSSIVIASQIMQRESSLSERDQQQLAEIRQVATSTQEMMRDIVWMLNPKNDSVDDFLLKMKEVAARLLPDIRYTFRAPGEKLLDRVSIDFKRNIFLIYKESLNNIVRHSSATEVAIEVKQGHDMFTMHIHDNGRGFDINQTVSGSGLANLRRRAELMGGKLDITSDTGKGTSITLAVKNHANA